MTGAHRGGIQGYHGWGAGRGHSGVQGHCSWDAGTPWLELWAAQGHGQGCRGTVAGGVRGEAEGRQDTVVRAAELRSWGAGIEVTGVQGQKGRGVLDSVVRSAGGAGYHG